MIGLIQMVISRLLVTIKIKVLLLKRALRILKFMDPGCIWNLYCERRLHRVCGKQKRIKISATRVNCKIIHFKKCRKQQLIVLTESSTTKKMKLRKAAQKLQNLAKN